MISKKTYTLQLLQLETRKMTDIILHDYNLLNKLETNLWITSLQKFLYKHKISARSQKKIIPTTIRRGDRETINDLKFTICRNKYGQVRWNNKFSKSITYE